MRLRLSVLSAALLCGAAVASAPAAGAAPEPAEASFALKPVLYDPALTATKSYFILSVEPGTLVKSQVRIVNTGGKTGTAFLYPVDATTGQTSGAVYLSRQSPRRDVGSWIRLSRSQVTLAPGANEIVPFSFRVPPSAQPGDHLGGIVAENSQVQKSSGRGALQIKIRHLTITAVEVQLPGAPLAAVEATGVRPGGEHGYQYVYLHLKSTGNVLVKPAAVLTVRNATGRVVARRQTQLDTFVPGTEIDYPVLLPRQALEPGDYTADVRLYTSKSRVLGYRKVAPPPFDVTRTFSFTVTSNEQTKVFSGVAPVTPPTASKPERSRRNYQLAATAGLIALLLVVLLLVFMRLRRARRRGQAPPIGPAPVVPSGTPAPPDPTAASAPSDDDGEDEPGWAGLLAAYETQPRHQTSGSHEEPESEPESAAEPESESEPEPEPTVAIGPLAMAAGAMASDPGSEQESQGARFEPPTAREVVAPPAVAPMDTEAVSDPDAFELRPEPWFESPPEPEFEPATAPTTTVLDTASLKHLITQHDLAVAESYFKPVEPEQDATQSASTPAPRRTAAGDVHTLSSALVETSLIALAAVLVTRFLRTAD